MLNNKQFVFIIGAPRSGTSWLHAILASHPEVAFTDAELTVFNRYVAPLVKSFELEQKQMKNGKWAQGLPHLWSREKFDRKVSTFIDDIYSSLNISSQHKVIIDKHPDYSFYIDLIHYYFPKAKLLHIIRDGRDVASSWHKASYKLGFGNSTFSGACLDWIKYKNSAEKAREFAPENYLEIRYENLMTDFHKELNRVLTFCQLTVTPEITELITLKNTGEENMVSSPDKTIRYDDRKKGKPIWEKLLTKEQQYLASKYLTEELIKEGYETSDNWGLNNLDSIIMYLKLKAKGIARRITKTP
jgi:hypothetical protein